MTVRRWVTAGLLALGLGAGSASATVFDTVDAGITAWGVGDLVQRYGKSRPGEMLGTTHNITLAKAGKIIKWGGAFSVAAELLNNALSWYYKQAQDAADPLGNWWNGIPPQFPEPVSFSADSTTYKPVSGGCFFISNGFPTTAWIAYTDVENGKYIAAYATNNPDGTVRYRAQRFSAWTTYQGALSEYKLLCDSGTRPQDETLDEFLKRNPNAAEQIKNIVKRYLRNHPEIALDRMEPRPNRNQQDDAVTDPELDTDKDGVDDGDETQIKKRNPGNRDHPDDGGPSDPNEPDSKPKDTDGDGIPDYRDGDDDNDGTPDEEEPTQPPACQKDKNCNPETEKDTDGDGQKDRDDPDDDNDGSPDQEEEEDGSDPKDPDSKPEDTDKDGTPDKKDPDDDDDGVPDEEDKDPKNPDVGKCSKGYNLGEDGNCYPEEEKPCPEGQISDGKGACIPDPKPCEEGYRKDANGNCQKKPDDCPEGQSPDDTGACKPDEDPEKCEDGSEPVEGKCGEDEEPVGDECGDLSLERAKAHLEHWVRDVVFPCEPVKDMIEPLYKDLKTRFPFSVAASLNGWFTPPTSDTASSRLPAKIGPIPLDWGWLTPLWSTIKTLVGVALYVWFVYWLIDRFTPRTGI